MKFTKTLRYYYHVTERDWPSEIILKPRSSLDVDCYNRGDAEPPISRTCVSSTIEGCFAAIPLSSYYNYYIYRTKCKIKAIHPWRVPDSKVTQEKWLVTPIKFIRCGEVRSNDLQKMIELVERFSLGHCNKENLEKQLRAREKFKKYLISIGVINENSTKAKVLLPRN